MLSWVPIRWETGMELGVGCGGLGAGMGQGWSSLVMGGGRGEARVCGGAGWDTEAPWKPLFSLSLSPSFPLSKLNSSSTGNLDKLGNSAPSPERGRSRDPQAYIPSPRTSTFRQRPYSMMNPDLSQVRGALLPTPTSPFAPPQHLCLLPPGSLGWHCKCLILPANIPLPPFPACCPPVACGGTGVPDL